MAAPWAVRAKYAYCAVDQRRDQLPLALAEQRGEHQRQQDRRKRQLQIDDPHDQRLDAPADEAGQRAQRGAEREGDGARHQPT